MSMIGKEEQLVSLIHIKNKAYKELESCFLNSDNPILLVGPYHCGKKYSVSNLCLQNAKNMYEIEKIKSDSDLYGYFDAKSEYQKSPLFMAYLNGEILYIDDIASSKNYFKTLIDISNSKTLEFPCGKIEKNKEFRIIMSMDKDEFLQLNKKVENKLDVVKFNYDKTVEKVLCPDVELYEILTEIRKICKKNSILISITTETFKNAYILKSLNSFKDEDILRSVLGGNFTRQILDILILSLTKLQNNRFYGILTSWR